MERYPVLNFILRYGKTASIAAALLAALVVAGLAWPALGWIAIGLAVIAGLVVFVLAKSYVEIVTIITDMLVPR
jgi:hypothetical protein